MNAFPECKIDKHKGMPAVFVNGEPVAPMGFLVREYFDLDYINFGLAKGMTWKRVLIVPTRGIRNFVQTGVHLDPIPAAKFYVAVTRAAQSVALVVDDRCESQLLYWNPTVAARHPGYTERIGPLGGVCEP